jgi:hypothetical protein
MRAPRFNIKLTICICLKKPKWLLISLQGFAAKFILDMTGLVLMQTTKWHEAEPSLPVHKSGNVLHGIEFRGRIQ